MKYNLLNYSITLSLQCFATLWENSKSSSRTNEESSTNCGRFPATPPLPIGTIDERDREIERVECAVIKFTSSAKSIFRVTRKICYSSSPPPAPKPPNRRLSFVPGGWITNTHTNTHILTEIYQPTNLMCVYVYAACETQYTNAIVVIVKKTLVAVVVGAWDRFPLIFIF